MPWYQAKPYAGYWGYQRTTNSFDPDVVGDNGLRDITSHYYPAISSCGCLTRDGAPVVPNFGPQ